MANDKNIATRNDLFVTQKIGIEIDDLRPWFEEMRPWLSAVCVPGTTAF